MAGNTFFHIGDPRTLKTDDDTTKPLLGNPFLSDVTFLIGPDKETAIRFPAHSQILANVSEKFQKQFSETWKRHGVIEIKDDATSMISVLRWIYRHELVIESLDKLMDVMRVAHMHEVDSLLKLVTDNFYKLSPEINWSLLSFALMHNQQTLSKRVMGSIVSRTVDQFKSHDFMNASSEAITEIISQHLNCEEIFLIEKCYNWAETRCREAGLEVNGINMRKLMETFVEQLAFPALPITTLSRFPLLKDILSDKEQASLLQCYAGFEVETKFRKDARKYY
jgi:hypothetical protein